MALLEVSVPLDLDGQRLDIILHKLIEEIPSRSFAARLVDNQLVQLSSKKSPKASLKLKAGEVFKIDDSIFLDAISEPQGEPIPLAIIYEDSDLIVLNKVSGMVVHPGAGVHSGTLVNAILSHCGQTLPSLGTPARAGIVHRLDKDTSGVMVVAKSQIALTGLSQQFASHKQAREYEALVYNSPQLTSGVVETRHGRDPRNRIKYAALPEGEGKLARMSYQCTQVFNEGLISQIRCSLFTGRTHQIRVQMTHLGCPLLGDSLYGQVPGKVKNKKEFWAELNPLLERQMLHASLLGFEHPRTGESLRFESPLPEDFLRVLQTLKKNS